MDRLNILKFVKRRMLLLYTFGAGLGFLQILSDISGWAIHIFSLTVATGLFIFFNIVLFAFLPRYRRLTSVRLQQNGVRYASRKVITWDEMTEVAFVWEDGLPYLSIKKSEDFFGEFHVPLYLQHLEKFRQKLGELIPKGHLLERLMPEIDGLDLRAIHDRVKWWHI